MFFLRLCIDKEIYVRSETMAILVEVYLNALQASIYHEHVESSFSINDSKLFQAIQVRNPSIAAAVPEGGIYSI